MYDEIEIELIVYELRGDMAAEVEWLEEWDRHLKEGLIKSVRGEPVEP